MTKHVDRLFEFSLGSHLYGEMDTKGTDALLVRVQIIKTRLRRSDLRFTGLRKSTGRDGQMIFTSRDV